MNYEKTNCSIEFNYILCQFVLANSFFYGENGAKIALKERPDIKTYAKKTLDVNIAGSSKISYKGTPEITKKIAGSGEIVSLN